MLVKKIIPRVDQILVTYPFSPDIEKSLVRMHVDYRLFKKTRVAYIQYATVNRYYHAPKA